MKPLISMKTMATASTAGRHHVHDGVFPFHACQMVGDRAGDGDAEIDDVERLGRVGNAGRQAVLLEGARRLGLDDLRAAHAEQRENGHGQHDVVVRQDIISK